MRNRLIVLALLVLLERGMALVIRWFEVLPIVVVLHFVVVLLIVAAVVGAGRVRGSVSVWVRVVLAFLALLSGAWVSAHIGGPEACQGFPLCNGAVLPSGAGLVLANWSHRIISFVTVGVVLFNTIREYRTKSHMKVRITALIAAVIVLIETGIGAGMVLRELPRWVVGIHLAAGVVLWADVIVWFRFSRTYYSS